MKIVLADDHALCRMGLRSWLEKNNDVKVVGEADNGRVVVNLVDKLTPDIVIIDLMMPELNGIEATRYIKSKHPDIKIIALSMYSEKQLVIQMLKAGALGYVLKEYAIKELTNAIQTVMKGNIYLSPILNTTLLKEKVLESGDVDSSSSVFTILTNREREVLQLIGEGKSTKVIAHDLFVSVKTIETHRQQIMSKLNIHSIAGLTKYAIREKLISLET